RRPFSAIAGARALASRASSAAGSAFLRKSPELSTLNRSWSPSSPYFPMSTERFSIAGVSRGAKPKRWNTPRMTSIIYWRRDMARGPKSRVPLGSAGFSIIGRQVNSPGQKTPSLGSHKIGQGRQTGQFSASRVLQTRERGLLLRSFYNTQVMATTRLKRKSRKDRSKANVRRVTLKNQNFKPVIRRVDVEKIKEEFKEKAG